jgi:hypothetical protein
MNNEESDEDENLDSDVEEERKHYAVNYEDLDANKITKLNKKYYDRIGYDQTKVS